MHQHYPCSRCGPEPTTPIGVMVGRTDTSIEVDAPEQRDSELPVAEDAAIDIEASGPCRRSVHAEQISQ